MKVSCSYTVNTVHILNIPGFVKCPGAGKGLTVKCPGAGNIFCANARGCPGGGMVRVGIERDIIGLIMFIVVARSKQNLVSFQIIIPLSSEHL